MRKVTLWIGVLLLVITSSNSLYANSNWIQWVKPNIGSVHSRWFFYSPAARPFGMAKLAPQTNANGSKGGWIPCGYDDNHNSIEGFGHFHEFQIGGVATMPSIGNLKTSVGTLDNPDSGYRSRFDKDSEIAQAGYYKVFLKDYNIKAELTATDRVGFHRYTFPKSKHSRIYFELGSSQGESGPVKEVYAHRTPQGLEGYVTTYPVYATFCDPSNTVTIYFYAVLDKNIDNTLFVSQDTINRDTKEQKGAIKGVSLEFSTKKGEQVNMKVALSYTSIDGAKNNYLQEASSKNFDIVKKECQAIWNEQLGKIEVKGGTDADKIKFYTGLYHAILGRGLASDYDGKYPKNDNTIGQIPLNAYGLPQYKHYNTDGIWGGFWNLTQVWALAYPNYLNDYCRSTIDFYKENGWFHDGQAAGVYTNGVQTNYQGLVIASAYNWGIRNYDIEEAYQGCLKNEIEWENRPFGSGKYDLNYFVKDGYIPLKDTTLTNGWVLNFGTSHTLEFCFSSFAVAQMAKSLGKNTDYLKLMKQARNWKNIFDPSIGFIRPKEIDGTFSKEFDPMAAWKGFQEGNGFQYTWYVPHDIPQLVRAIGKDRFNKRLENMFENARKSLYGGGKEHDSFSGVEKLYNHGNQPCLHNAFLFNFSGKPWLTQKWSHLICKEFYGITGEHGYGYGQDEDEGQLGSWYVLASIGLFDVWGGTLEKPIMQIASPMFDEVTIHLDQRYYTGKYFVIKTLNNRENNYYVTKANLNGKPMDTHWLYFDNITQGGTLEIEKSSTPNKNWGLNFHEAKWPIK